MESHDIELKGLDTDDGPKKGVEPPPSPPSPLDSCSFLSLLFVSFLNPLLRLGSKCALGLHDIPALPASESIEVSAAAFESHWQARKKAGDKTYAFIFSTNRFSLWILEAWKSTLLFIDSVVMFDSL